MSLLLSALLGISTILVASPTAFADSDLGTVYDNPAEGVNLKGSSGSPQVFYRSGDSVVCFANAELNVLKNGKIKTIATQSIGFFFVVGREIVSYSNFPEKKHHYWFSYNLDTGKIKYKVVPTMDSPFWSDQNGIFVSSGQSVYYLNLKTGKTKKLGIAPGQPRGYVDGKLISIVFGQRQVVSGYKGKSTIIYQGNKDFRSSEIISNQVYIIQATGMSRLEANGKLTKIFNRYAAILAVIGDYFLVAEESSGSNDLSGGSKIYITDGKVGALLTDTDFTNLGVNVMYPYISPDGTAVVYYAYDTPNSFRADIPPRDQWKKLPQ